jgi:hypothetical protein
VYSLMVQSRYNSLTHFLWHFTVFLVPTPIMKPFKYSNESHIYLKSLYYLFILICFYLSNHKEPFLILGHSLDVAVPSTKYQLQRRNQNDPFIALKNCNDKFTDKTKVSITSKEIRPFTMDYCSNMCLSRPLVYTSLIYTCIVLIPNKHSIPPTQ